MTDVAAVIVAAGRGNRAGGALPKQYRPLGPRNALRMSLEAFARHPEVSVVQPVIHPADEELYRSASEGLVISAPVRGGDTRQASVQAGLTAFAKRRPVLVLVHDAARPFASASLISRAIEAGRRDGAAVPALSVTDAMKRIDAGGTILENIDRDGLMTVQTPQAFRYDMLYEVHRRAANARIEEFPDDAALAQWAGIKVRVFDGEPNNIKLTTEADFARAETILAGVLGDVRTGSGIDVHAFGSGDHVTLGGVRIAHDRGLSGHSDADVVLHAVVDAILGALADGDIGVHFPPSDLQWRGASSDRFVAFTMERLRKRGGRIAHLDINIVCASPRIGPHRDAMRDRIAQLCDVSIERVAIKATTSEGLGFTGRDEGVAAFATATVRLPASLLEY